VLVGSAALLATAGVELSAEVEAHMASVQVLLPCSVKEHLLLRMSCRQ
jgi:hypothetical protein